MKIAISNIAWKNEEEATVARYLRAAGVRGVDVAYTKFWPSPNEASAAALQAYRQFWEQQGIAIVGMQSIVYGRPDLMLFGNARMRDALATYLMDVFRLAGALGARLLVFGSPKNRLKGDLSEAAAMDSAVDFFARLAPAAAQANVVLCIEPNPPEYGCDFITTTAAGVDLVRQVNHPHIRLHLDAAIMTMNGEDIEAALHSASGCLAHFHVSEPSLGVVGEGFVEHVRFAEALRWLGYQGWVSIEMRSGWKASDLAAVRTAVPYTQAVYGD